MAHARFDQLPRARRDEILRTAAEEFARSGFHGTSYNQLLDRLQLGKSSAYYYFQDKRDLFLTALEHCYSTFYAMVGQLERPSDVVSFWAYVERASLLGFEFMLQDPTAAHLMLCLQRERALLDALGSHELLAVMDTFYETAILEGQKLGAVRVDLPQHLIVSVVRDLATSFDRWFIETRGQESAGASPAMAARAFTDVLERLCEPW